MIFRKSSEPQQTVKTPMTGQRTEPSLTARGPTVSPQLQVTQPVAAPNANAAPRRNAPGGTPPAAAYQQQRAEQVRKLTVGRDITLNGEIATCDHLIVEGTVKATIKGGKMLDITETGSFAGVVEIDQADIAGHFDGELIVKGKLVIRASANVMGAIYYAQLQVDTGARINGQLQTIAAQKATPVEQPASFENAITQNGFGLSALNDTAGFLKASA